MIDIPHLLESPILRDPNEEVKKSFTGKNKIGFIFSS
jgi:hypothetical protein